MVLAHALHYLPATSSVPLPLRLLLSICAPLFVIASAASWSLRSHRPRLSHVLKSSATILAVGVAVDVLIWQIPPLITFDILYYLAASTLAVGLLSMLTSKLRAALALALAIVAFAISHFYLPLYYTSDLWEPSWASVRNADPREALPIIARQIIVSGWFPILGWMPATLLALAYFSAPHRKTKVPWRLLSLVVATIAFACSTSVIDLLLNSELRDNYLECFYPALPSKILLLTLGALTFYELLSYTGLANRTLIRGILAPQWLVAHLRVAYALHLVILLSSVALSPPDSVRGMLIAGLMAWACTSGVMFCYDQLSRELKSRRQRMRDGAAHLTAESLGTQSTRSRQEAPDYSGATNLVFQGGGAKVLALVGALNVVEGRARSPIRLGRCVGTSAGAILAALKSGGYSANELLQILRATDLVHLAGVSRFSIILAPFRFLTRGGMFPASRIAVFVDELLRKRLAINRPVRFCDLPNPLSVVVCDATTRRVVVFSERTTPEAVVGWAVKYSSTIPGVFIPHERDGSKLFDGGLVMNMPLSVVAECRAEDPPQASATTIAFGLLQRYRNTRNQFAAQWLGLLDTLTQWTSNRQADIGDPNVVWVDPAPVGTADFGMSSTERDFLFLRGAEAAHKYCDRDLERFQSTSAGQSRLRPAGAALRRGRRYLRTFVGYAALFLFSLVGAVHFLTFVSHYHDDYTVETVDVGRGLADAEQSLARPGGVLALDGEDQGAVLVIANTQLSQLRVVDNKMARNLNLRQRAGPSVDNPVALCASKRGGVYVACAYSNNICHVTWNGAYKVAVSVIAGDGAASGHRAEGYLDADLDQPMGLCRLGDDVLIVADSGNNRVIALDFANRIAYPLLARDTEEDGVCVHPDLDFPQGVGVITHRSQDFLFVANTWGDAVLRCRLSLVEGKLRVAACEVLSTVGDYGQASLVPITSFHIPSRVKFILPYSVAVAGSQLLVADYGNRTLWRLDNAASIDADATAEFVAGVRGPVGGAQPNPVFGSDASFARLACVTAHGGDLWIADEGRREIRRIRPRRY